jgi:hypothetical protein
VRLGLESSSSNCTCHSASELPDMLRY